MCLTVHELGATGMVEQARLVRSDGTAIAGGKESSQVTEPLNANGRGCMLT